MEKAVCKDPSGALSAELQSMKLEEYLPTASSTDVTANLESLDATESITTATSSFTGTDEEKPGLTLVSPEACSTLRFEDHYEVLDKLAKGSFGTVYVAKHRHSGDEFAVKVIERKKLTASEKNGVVREVSILRDCRDVEHIVRLIDFYASPKYFYVVQVYAQGGDLFKRLASSSSYSEKDARDLAIKLLNAMAVLHGRKIVHRDLKPENLLLQDLLNDTKILIADFGFARYVPKEGLRTRCGSKLLLLSLPVLSLIIVTQWMLFYSQRPLS
jgi:serine/threonine protein kinase